jgi:UDP-N-acetylglucosamine 3-dehydrogenase
MSLRVAVIGCGAIARRAHLPGFSPAGSPEADLADKRYRYGGCEDTRIVAVVDIDRAKAEAAARDFKVPECSTDWKAVVSSKDVDIVSIAAPNYLHAEVAIQAMKNGKHVLVEKPMAINLAEADQMVQLSKKAGVLLMCEQTMRFSGENAVAKDLVARGLIGKIRSFRSRHSHAGPHLWSPSSTWFFDPLLAGGGTIIDLGVHNIDFLRWLVGEEVVETAAFATQEESHGQLTDRTAVATLRFRNGTIGVAEMSWNTDPSDNSTILYGERGNLYIGKRSPTLYVEYPERENMGFNFDLPAGIMENARFIPAVTSKFHMGGAFRHFASCIKNGTAPAVPCEDSRNTVAVILAILESAKTGKFVQLK